MASATVHKLSAAGRDVSAAYDLAQLSRMCSAASKDCCVVAEPSMSQVSEKIYKDEVLRSLSPPIEPGSRERSIQSAGSQITCDLWPSAPATYSGTPAITNCVGVVTSAGVKLVSHLPATPLLGGLLILETACDRFASRL